MRKEAILDIERVELEQIRLNPKTQQRLIDVAKTVFHDASIFDMVVDDVICYLDDDLIDPNPAQWNIFFDELIYSVLGYFVRDNYICVEGLSTVSMGMASFSISPEAFITVEREIAKEARENDI